MTHHFFTKGKKKLRRGEMVQGKKKLRRIYGVEKAEFPDIDLPPFDENERQPREKRDFDFIIESP